jgi:hypothetical protein
MGSASSTVIFCRYFLNNAGLSSAWFVIGSQVSSPSVNPFHLAFSSKPPLFFFLETLWSMKKSTAVVQERGRGEAA